MGFALNVLGAIWLLWVAVNEVLSKDLQPTWRTSARAAARWVRNPRFRRSRPDDGSGRVITARVTSSTTVRADEDDWEGRVEYLELAVDGLRSRLEKLHTQLERDSVAAKQREARAQAQAARIEAGVKDQELWGLLVVAVGTALQGAAMYLG